MAPGTGRAVHIRIRRHEGARTAEERRGGSPLCAASHTLFLYLIFMVIVGVPKAYRLPYYAPYSSRST